MRPAPLALLVAGVVMAACSKPAPAAGAPSPDAVTIDSTKTTADSAATATAPDSTAKDSTITAAKDSASAAPKDSAATMSDSAAKPDSTVKP